MMATDRILCDSCRFYHRESHHCEHPNVTKWGVVTGSTACNLYIPSEVCDNCDYVWLSGGCKHPNSNRMGDVSGFPKCKHFVPRREGDKRGGLITNLDVPFEEGDYE